MQKLNWLLKGAGMALLLGVLLLPCKVKAADYTIENERVIDSINDRIEYTLNQHEYDSWEEAAEDLGRIVRNFGAKRAHQLENIKIPIVINAKERIPEIDEAYAKKFKKKVGDTIFQEETGNPDLGHTLQVEASPLYGLEVKYEDGKYTGVYTGGLDYQTPLEVYKNFQEGTTEVLNSLNLDGKSDYEKCLLIEEWVGKHITYKENYGNTERYCPAVFAYFSKTGVCAHYADLFYYMANKAGLLALEDSGTLGYSGHAWNLVKIDGMYYYTDPTNFQNFTFVNGTAKAEFLYGSDDFSFHRSYKSSNEYKDRYPIASEMYSKDHSSCNGKHEFTIRGVQGGCYPGTVYKCKNCFYEYCVYTGEEDHEYVDGDEIITQKADCTHEEITTYRCHYCRNADYTKVTGLALGHDYQKEEVEPTCTKDGYIKYTCSRCNDTYTEPGKEKLGHDYKETVLKETTCLVNGKVQYTCSRCNDTYTNIIQKYGHDYKETSVIPATCKTGTIHILTCTRCGGTSRRIDDDKKSEHDWITTKEQKTTCTEDGFVTRKCKVCGTTKTETTKATGHAPEVLNAVEATCTEDGYTGDTYCKTCGALISKGKTIDKLGHFYDEGKVIKEATKEEEGLKEYTCKRCGEKKEETIPKYEHLHDSYEEIVIKKATCKEPGIMRYQCTECDYYYDTVIPELGHGELEYRNQKEATCTEDGYTGDGYCKNCGELFLEGDVIEKLGHSYDNGKVIKAATYTQKGLMEYTCERCNEKKREEIPMLKFDLKLSVQIKSNIQALFQWDTKDSLSYQGTQIQQLNGTDYETIEENGWTVFAPDDQKQKTFYRARGHYQYKTESGSYEDVYTEWVEFSLFNDPEPDKPTPVKPTKPVVKVKKVTISGTSHVLSAGKKIQLKATVTPANAKSKAVTWKSSNTKYATVNAKGVVATKKAGIGKKVVITAISKDGSKKYGTYKIKTVKGVVTKVKVTGSKTIKNGKSAKLKVAVSGTKESYKAVRWVSSNTKYATVNAKGVVTAKKAGKGKTVKITAVAKDGSKKQMAMKVKIK